jgi:hypothetical protein
MAMPRHGLGGVGWSPAGGTGPEAPEQGSGRSVQNVAIHDDGFKISIEAHQYSVVLQGHGGNQQIEFVKPARPDQ